MTPVQAIAMLDRQLARHGEDIILQRLATDIATGAQFALNQVDPCRAMVRANEPQELSAMTGEAPNTHVILSPTDLARAMFPGVPQKDDRLIIQGRNNNVEIVSPIYLAGQLVRINIECRT